MSSMRFSDGTVIKSEAFIMNCMVTTTPLERLEWLKNLQTEVDSHNCNCEYCDYGTYDKSLYEKDTNSDTKNCYKLCYFVINCYMLLHFGTIN